VALGQAYGDAATFLDTASYRNVNRWIEELSARPAVQRGSRVNLNPTDARPDLIRERHGAADLD
jgi:GST-like protein